MNESSTRVLESNVAAVVILLHTGFGATTVIET